MKKQAIIFDIDGTAIDSPEQKLPTARLTKAAGAVRQDYYLSAATGRVWSFAKPVLQAMQLTDPCIISGGTQICEPQTGKILWQCNLEPADLKAAATILKDYPEYKVLWNDYADEDYLHGGESPDAIKLDEEVYFLEMIFVPQAVAPEIGARLGAIEGIACILALAQRPGYIDIHITNRGATKEHAVAELLKTLKLDRQDATGIGDGHNDLHLFAAVNHKVAMSNAVAELKAQADQVIGNVAEDGLAAYLESLHFNAEKVDILDDNGKIVKQALKIEAHKQGWLHKTVFGCLKYGDEWSMVRQAPDRQDAGQLVSPVGGHVKAGESEVEALLRECEEEIGTRNITYKEVGRKVFHRQVIGRDENHLFVVYEIATDDPIVLGKEAVSIERFRPDEMKKALREYPENFGGAHYFVLEAFYPDYLPKDYIKRWT
jgi:HAD superfamily hydrolase (TIGR01484 family)